MLLGADRECTIKNRLEHQSLKVRGPAGGHWSITGENGQDQSQGWAEGQGQRGQVIWTVAAS